LALKLGEKLEKETAMQVEFLHNLIGIFFIDYYILKMAI